MTHAIVGARGLQQGLAHAFSPAESQPPPPEASPQILSAATLPGASSLANVSAVLAQSVERFPTRFWSRFGIGTIAATFGVFGVCAASVPLASAVVAPGVVAAESSRKQIQHLEGGIVQRVLVEEAQHVEAGQLLVELAPTAPQADKTMVLGQSEQMKAVRIRLLAEQALADSIDFAAAGLDSRNPESAGLVESQKLAFQQRRAALDAQAEIIQARIRQFDEVLAGLDVQARALTDQRRSVGDELKRLRRGYKNGVITANEVSLKEQRSAELEGSAGEVRAEIARTRQSIGELELEIAKARDAFRERAGDELRETEAKLRQLREQIAVADDRLDRTDIRAPLAGIVQNIKVHTVGGVVRPGDTLLEIVPSDGALVVLAHVRPNDIDSVRSGENAEIKFSALSGRLQPMLEGRILSVSSDVISPSSERETAYYLARIEISPARVPEDVRRRIVAGMPVEAVIATGKRTMLEYLLSPIREIVAGSMREK